MSSIERLGGEGLIVRDPEAEYLAGRRPEILKVKSFEDGEAMVVGHLPGQGKNAALGTTITFKHHGHYRSGVPKFPVFLRIRRDLGL